MMKYEALKRIDLQCIAEEACDFLGIHQRHWPRVILKRVGMEGDMGECIYNDQDKPPVIHLYNNYLKTNNVSQVSTLLHECAHIAITYGLKLDMEAKMEETIVVEWELSLIHI